MLSSSDQKPPGLYSFSWRKQLRLLSLLSWQCNSSVGSSYTVVSNDHMVCFSSKADGKCHRPQIFQQTFFVFLKEYSSVWPLDISVSSSNQTKLWGEFFKTFADLSFTLSLFGIVWDHCCMSSDHNKTQYVEKHFPFCLNLSINIWKYGNIWNNNMQMTVKHCYTK